MTQATQPQCIQNPERIDAGAMQMRPSSKGNYLAITCTVNATSQAQLDALYIELSSHPMVKVVL